MTAARPTAGSSRSTLVVAAIVLVALERFVPYGRYVLYPFTLLSTWVHEMGHGVTALLVGGRFEKLEIFADASGLAHVVNPLGWHDALVCAGGLLAPPLLGALVLAVSRGPRRAAVIHVALVAALAFSLAWWVRSTTGLVAMAPLTLALAAFARFIDGAGRMLLARFLGLVLALDTVTRIDYVFRRHAVIDGVDRASDIARVADGLGGPWLAWSLLVAGASLALLVAGVWAAWRPERLRAGRARP